MKKIFLGAPGSGKGSYASRIAPKRNIPHISTGDLFRENLKQGTEIGLTAKGYMERGELVPDEVVVEMLKERIEREDCKDGFILDGFPRTIPQAKMLADITDMDVVVNMNVPNEVIVKRLSSRISCKDCGEIYNLRDASPKKENICNKCQGEVIRRSDDEPEVVLNRLKTYEEKTAPLIKFYEDQGILRHVECTEIDKPVEEMAQIVLETIEGFAKELEKGTSSMINLPENE
jgi:adenylate kinase